MTSKTDTNPCGACRTGYGKTHMCRVLAEQNADLLAALEACAEFLKEQLEDDEEWVEAFVRPRYDQARRAIAKAKGEA